MLDNAPQSGRPGDDNSNRIETLIENNQHYTVQETADILSKSIKLLVKIKNVSFILREKNHTDFLANPVSLLLSNCLLSGGKDASKSRMNIFLSTIMKILCDKCTKYN